MRVVSINNSYRFPSRLGPTSWESPTGSAIAYIDVLTYRLSKLRANSFFLAQTELETTETDSFHYICMQGNNRMHEHEGVTGRDCQQATATERC